MPKSVALLAPGSLESRTGGYIYDRRIVEGLRSKGWAVEVHSLDESFPQPTGAALAHAAAIFSSLRTGTIAVIDSLALGAMPEILERERARIRIVGLVHLPLAAEFGLDEDTARRVAIAERRSLAAAAQLVVTGHATLEFIDAYGVPRSQVAVIEPGTDPAPLAAASSGRPVQLLTVATLNPGKGHEDLLLALAEVPDPDWRLTCAGSLTRHPRTAARIRTLVRERHLDDRVSIVGEVGPDALDVLYGRSDAFVLATLRETYGMAVAEALAHGLPVVSTRTGAIPSLVGSDAGLVVQPGDVRGLTKALWQVICDAELRERLASGARRVRTTLRRWDDAVGEMAATLEALGHD